MGNKRTFSAKRRGKKQRIYVPVYVRKKEKYNNNKLVPPFSEIVTIFSEST